MKTRTQHWLFALITTFAAMAVFTNSSFADTTQSNTDENNGQMMQPGMYGGMGPGHMGYGGMGPGNMGYGRMGPVAWVMDTWGRATCAVAWATATAWE